MQRFQKTSKKVLNRVGESARGYAGTVKAVVVGCAVAGSNLMAAGSLGTVPAIDVADFTSVALVVLAFSGIAFGIKKAMSLIGK